MHRFEENYLSSLRQGLSVVVVVVVWMKCRIVEWRGRCGIESGGWGSSGFLSCKNFGIAGAADQDFFTWHWVQRLGDASSKTLESLGFKLVGFINILIWIGRRCFHFRWKKKIFPKKLRQKLGWVEEALLGWIWSRTADLNIFFKIKPRQRLLQIKNKETWYLCYLIKMDVLLFCF